MRNPTQQNNVSAKPKHHFRINFYGFLIIVGLLVGAVLALAFRFHSNVQSFHDAKQAGRASVADIKAESQKIDAAWHSLQNPALVSYSSAEKECIKKEGNKELSTCLPQSIFAKLSIRSTEPALTTGDKLAQLLDASGWRQRTLHVTINGNDQPRADFNELPANFQSLRLYYFSSQQGDAERCISLIYASKNAQTPGWSGYLGKCSSSRI